MKQMFPNSSNIDYADYNVDDSTLTIKFKSGGIYKYDSVPQSVYGGICNADSAGKYFHKYIRGAYDYKRLA